MVIYDKMADRWLFTQFAVTQAPFSQCIAVSTSADPTGTYARYEYQYPDFNDYPKFGVWPMVITVLSTCSKVKIQGRQSVRFRA